MAERQLKNGEIEIHWIKPNVVEVLQTDGLAYNAGAIVCDVRGHKIIIPMSSVKRFRVKAI